MSIPLTPLEHEVVYHDLPKNLKAIGVKEAEVKEHQVRWHKFIESEDSESKRVDLLRKLLAVQPIHDPPQLLFKDDAGDEKERKAKFLSALTDLLGQSKPGPQSRREAASRLDTLHSLSVLPKEIPLTEGVVNGIVGHEDHRGQLREFLVGHVKHAVDDENGKLGELHPQGVEALGDGEWLRNLFLYNAHFATTGSDHSSLFRELQRAFLNGGVEGVKRIKFGHDHFKSAGIEDEKLAGFLESLDSKLGTVHSGKTEGELDLYNLYAGKLEDFAEHSKQEDLNASLKAVEKLTDGLSATVKGAGKVEGIVDGLLKENDHSKIPAAIGKLRGLKGLKGREERARAFSIGALSKLAAASKISPETIRTGLKVAERFRQLKGKSPAEQRSMLEAMQREFGREALEGHRDALNAAGKQTGKDLGYFIGEVLNPPKAQAGGEVSGSITHDPRHLFTLGKFQNNCQSPGTQQCPSILGYTAHPQEVTLAFHTPQEEGEGMDFSGFAFAHVLEHKEKKGRYAVVFERPYTDHGELKPAMDAVIEKARDRIEGLAKKAGLKLEAHTRATLPRNQFKVLPSRHGLTKYYDIAGGVHGGEVIGEERREQG